MNLSGLKPLLVVCIVLISLVGVSYGLECHHCNSEFDPRCADPFDPYSLGVKNCSLEEGQEEHLSHLKATLCRKTVQKVYGKVRVVRGCGYIRDDNLDDKRCIKRSGTHDVYALYCSCTGEKCNTAPQSIAVSTLLLSLPIVSSLVMMLRTRNGNLINH